MIDNTVIMSSRIRLARCLSNYPFPHKMSQAQGYSVMNEVASVVKPLGEYKLYTMQDLPALDAEVMQEKHLISKNLLNNTDFGAVILSADQSVSIMINEEDHIRAQCFLKGLALDKAYQTLSAIDDKIIENLDVAFDLTYGFLNSCITNIGTGMRASVMMFLPALTISGRIDSVISMLKNQGLTVRGVFGEGSEASSYMYQISNARSLGVNEKEIIAKVTQLAMKVSSLEIEEREKLARENPIELRDRVYRAYGVLTNAFIISAEEFMKCVGEVKMEISLGFIRLKDNSLIDKLLFDALPSSLTKLAGEEALGETEEKITRAKFVAKTLQNSRIK